MIHKLLWAYLPFFFSNSQMPLVSTTTTTFNNERIILKRTLFLQGGWYQPIFHLNSVLIMDMSIKTLTQQWLISLIRFSTWMLV